MNTLTIIGNLVRDPVIRQANGKNVCSFTVAVARRKSANGEQVTDYFQVSAWDKLGESCGKHLAKGKKVCVIGPVTCATYQANDGTFKAQMNVRANEIEFLSPRETAEQAPKQTDSQSGFVQVEEDDLPF